MMQGRSSAFALMQQSKQLTSESRTSSCKPGPSNAQPYVPNPADAKTPRGKQQAPPHEGRTYVLERGEGDAHGLVKRRQHTNTEW